MPIHDGKIEGRFASKGSRHPLYNRQQREAVQLHNKREISVRMDDTEV
jgi:hypothetical protein